MEEKLIILSKDGKNIYGKAKEPKSYYTIENANHTFDENGNEELLFTETLAFINNQL